MMLLTFVDVVARYVFHRPVRGAFEVTELMLLVLIFAGLPLVSLADEHVTMDFIDRCCSAGGRLRLLERLVQAVDAGFMFLLAWLIWLKAGRIWAYGDTTDVLRISSARSSTSWPCGITASCTGQGIRLRALRARRQAPHT